MHLQESLFLAMVGSAILTVGVLSLCAHFASALSRERILLWFGLFAGPYGAALICHSVFLPPWGDPSNPWIIIIARVMGLSASVPALLLFQDFYGSGWRLSTRWLIWIYAVSMLAVVLLMVIHERSSSIPSPGITLVILVPLALLIDHTAGYRPPPIEGRPVIFAGLCLFFLTFSYDHLSHWRQGSPNAVTEPFGFLALTICLGFVVSRRVAKNEAEWLSMTDEMRAARKIQAAILPSSMPSVDGFSIAARYAPMTAVAGDFYGFPGLEPQGMGIVVADVMGHGVPAALVASMVKVSVNAGAERHQQPSEIIQSLNQTLCKEAPGQLATAVYVALHSPSRTGRYSAAGHPAPLLWREGAQRIEPLNATGLLLGVRTEEKFQDTEFRFSPGDRLLVFSDGLIEAENAAGLSFGDSRLPEIIFKNRSLPVEQFASKLLDEVLRWSAADGEPNQSDDITFIVIDLA